MPVKKITVIFLILCMTGLAACGGGGNAVDVASIALNIPTDRYPAVDGSTLTIPFSEAVAAAVMHTSIEEARTYVLHNKTHAAYTNLVDGKADIIFVTPPSQEELNYAKEAGVELEVIPILHDGFMFFVNAKNPVSSLSSDDIVKIYSGEITNWKDLGGSDSEITAYQRGVNSGSQTGMQNIVMKDVPMVKAPQELIIGLMDVIIDAVAFYDNAESAIGYSYYYYAQNMWRDDRIKYLKVNGVAPSDESIADGSYPFISDTCMVLRKDEPADSSARKLADWILSDEGRMVAKGAGYVPIQ
ncbi:MAG: substrate-binding domain-containing protein [Clostridiales Family XIII bacterium]|jgi:phosphate transport system substrate-binding protein|nr:substrate-binding domain-containing protein [Clostridiales Family XIII bacterium]